MVVQQRHTTVERRFGTRAPAHEQRTRALVLSFWREERYHTFGEDLTGSGGTVNNFRLVGNLSTTEVAAGTTTNTYDYENRLLTVTLPAPATTTFTYNGEGRGGGQGSRSANRGASASTQG